MNLLDLPCELALQILSHIPLPTLLSLTTVSRRFAVLVLSDLRDRNRDSSQLTNNHLSYHIHEPCDRYTTPLVKCLPGPKPPPANQTSRAGTSCSSVDQIRFPILHDLTEVLTTYTTLSPREAEFGRPPSTKLKRMDGTLAVDAGRRFTQLVFHVFIAGTSMVRLASGVVRVFRDWLQEGLEAGRREEERRSVPIADTVDLKPSEESILWLGDERDLGLRMTVLQSSVDAESREVFALEIHGMQR